MLEVRKTPQELIEWAKKDELIDVSNSEDCLAFLFTMGLFEDGPDVKKILEWLEGSGYLLEKGWRKMTRKFMKNLIKSNVIVDGLVRVEEVPPTTMDLLLIMLAARGFIEVAEVE